MEGGRGLEINEKAGIVIVVNSRANIPVFEIDGGTIIEFEGRVAEDCFPVPYAVLLDDRQGLAYGREV